MSFPIELLTGGADPAAAAGQLEAAWAAGRLVGLADPGERALLAQALLAQATGPGPSAMAPCGPGVVVGSGGSTGGRQWCLQPLEHLQASAEASGRWLGVLGIDPARCLHLNPLPLHHVSGLLPLVRTRRWGAELRWLAPALMRQPERLAAACPLPPGRPVLLSLVPTQLRRLMAVPQARDWLRGCAVIWVGGAALPAPLAAEARRQELPLAPCYGTTETAAMVCALPPRRFLAGDGGCGMPLADVELRIDPALGAVEVRSSRLSPGRLVGGAWEPLALAPGGWWRSGDGGRLGPDGLELLGRLDGAILSGAETVFPEQLEARLLAEASRLELPLQALLLLGQPDTEWGERLVALVRAKRHADGGALLQGLQAIAEPWPAAQRPHTWCLCPELMPSTAGKWERQRWQEWLMSWRASAG